jgi:hypothetical protein
MHKSEFYYHCCRLGLTLKETELAEKICSTLLLFKYASMIQQLESRPDLLEKLKMLLENE